MKDQKLYMQWLAYFIKRDHISKLLLLVTIVSFVIMGIMSRTPTMLYVSVGLLVVTVLFSFLSFLTMGRYRINRENKFYDAVAFDCGWERSYKGREAKRVIPKWQGLKIESLTLNIDKASYVTTSINKWKTIKMSVLDEFPLKASGLVTIFDNHSQGKLTFQA